MNKELTAVFLSCSRRGRSHSSEGLNFGFGSMTISMGPLDMESESLIGILKWNRNKEELGNSA